MNSAGEKRFRSVSALQENAGRKIRSVPKSAPGSFIDFHINPTVTALSPLAAFAFESVEQRSTPSLNTEGFLDVLSVDFARALKDLAIIMSDLKRLSSLGDLPISLEEKSTLLRIRFPGCDSDTVERLCDEVGVQRGIIYQDESFLASVGGEMALMFPFASTSEHTPSSLGGSLRSQTGHEVDELEDEDFIENPWVEGYESMVESASDSTSFGKPIPNRSPRSQLHSSSGFEDVEGIYRFLEQCDNARRRV